MLFHSGDRTVLVDCGSAQANSAGAIHSTSRLDSGAARETVPK